MERDENSTLQVIEHLKQSRIDFQPTKTSESERIKRKILSFPSKHIL